MKLWYALYAFLYIFRLFRNDDCHDTNNDDNYQYDFNDNCNAADDNK